MKRFLVDALVGIAFAALTLGCATSMNVPSSKAEPETMRQEQQESLQEMLYPSPNQ